MQTRFDQMEPLIAAGILLDFYGQFLTEKTRESMELHFSDDMSMSEISELKGISRQAVHDHIRRGMETLRGYEKKLGLAQRFVRHQSSAQDALAALDRGDLDRVRTLLEQIAEEP